MFMWLWKSPITELQSIISCAVLVLAVILNGIVFNLLLIRAAIYTKLGINKLKLYLVKVSYYM